MPAARRAAPAHAPLLAATLAAALCAPAAARAQDTARTAAPPAAAPAAPAAPAPDSALVAALTRARLPVSVGADGALGGAGGRRLVDEARAARFVLLGEEHGVAEVPRVTAALFRELAPAGYRHLAIETGAAVASRLDSLVRAGDAEGAVARFVSAHYPGVPFYALREEARLLGDAAAAARHAGARGEVLWGLDYDVMLDRWALARLRALAPTPAARAAAERVQAQADSMLRGALRAGNPGALFAFAAPESAAVALRAAYRPAPGSEADRILEQVEATLRINALYGAGRGHESNAERARFLKRNLARRLDAARGRDGAPPRVLVKIGLNHALRGRNLTSTYDVGSLLPELAEARGERALTVVLLAGRGGQGAHLDPRTLGYAPGPSELAGAAWVQPLHAAADPAGWTLLDLRALRPQAAAGRLGRLAPQLTQLIFGADLAVVLTGSGPSTPLVAAPPAALLSAGRP